ncbi:ABC transporter substrate-binding protein [Paenibacillus piri]|uniref:Sugar ABC transporter substrate-binding protein n=1 Tax=Paenibacillus piri TaxID=2547395 RepID=A0A4R5KF94_9BACL|nr:sugar ABC transporter substrate-binding protein [Paenibacillus piri]TDF93278.1 sugar ABC transporter substrate-binding protein [Paenibacillus piri]
MKKMLSGLTAGLLAVSVIGCSGQQAAAPSDKKESGKPADGKTTEITMISQGTWEKTGLLDVVAGFEKENPGIKVKVESYPFRQLFETIEVKLGSKSKDYDIITVDGPLVANYSVKGYLEPLETYLPAGEWKTKWIDSSIKAGQYDGKLMAAPMNTSSQVLYYNKDIFAAKGVTPPDFDIQKRWTWDQVVDTAKKLTYDTNGDGQPDVFGFSFEQISRAYQMLALSESLGAKVIDDKGLKTTGFINSDASVQAAKFYYDLFNTWKVSPRVTPDESKEYFKAGKIAIYVGGTWNTGTFSEAKVNYGIAPHPFFAGKKVATPTGSWHLGINKYSEKKEAAAKFIRYLTIGEGAKTWFNGNKDLPSNVDILKMIESDKKFDEFPTNVYRIATYEAQNTAVSRPLTPGFLDWETLYNKAYEDIKNGTDPKKALDDVAAQMDRQLKKYESVVK